MSQSRVVTLIEQKPWGLDPVRLCRTCQHYVAYREPIVSFGRCFRYHGITAPSQDGAREEEFLPRVADLHLCSEWTEKQPQVL